MIRKAEAADVFEIAFLAKQFSKEVNDSMFGFDPKTLTTNLEGALTNDSFLVLVSEQEGEVVGFMVATTTQNFFSTHKIACELAWYMSPDHRGTEALKLVKEFEKWAEDKQCNRIVMADVHVLQDLGAMYERKGYKCYEKAYVKGI